MDRLDGNEQQDGSDGLGFDSTNLLSTLRTLVPSHDQRP